MCNEGKGQQHLLLSANPPSSSPCALRSAKSAANRLRPLRPAFLSALEAATDAGGVGGAASSMMMSESVLSFASALIRSLDNSLSIQVETGGMERKQRTYIHRLLPFTAPTCTIAITFVLVRVFKIRVRIRVETDNLILAGT